jgi:acetyltransferase-like isoleucine patch superfamily enzyme
MTLPKLIFLIRGRRKKIASFMIPATVRIQKGVDLRIGKSCAAVEIGEGSEIRSYTLIEADGVLKIGKGCVVGFSNWFQCTGEIVIGDGVIIGPHVNIVASDHIFGNGGKVRESGLKRSFVRIGDNVWIAAGVTIACGVTIGANSVIGANSFVREDVPPDSVYGGVPARNLKLRSQM